MHNHTGKTKTAMLVELESIKDLLIEDDHIPILQEVVLHPVDTLPRPALVEQSKQGSYAEGVPSLLSKNDSTTAVSTTEEQQDFFPYSLIEEPAPVANSEPSLLAPNGKGRRSTPVKAAGQNPFLPEHIRARLQGNSPSPFSLSHLTNTANRFGTSNNGSARSAFLKKISSSQQQISSSHQQLVDEIMESLLPDMERELRQRLTGMSTRMLEDLLDEKK